MKKLLAVLLTVSLCFSCAVISTGAAIAPIDRWFGDVNRDNLITIEDVTAVQRYLAEMVTWTYDSRYQADYNHDNIVSVKDVTEMQRTIAEFPQPEGYGGCYMYTNYLIQSVHSDYASDTMPAGTPVTFTARSLQEVTFVFCVNNMVVQPRSASNTFTYTFTEPGGYEITVYALNETGFRTIHRYSLGYLVKEAVSDTEVRITRLWGEHEWDNQNFYYYAQYGATGGTGPYTYEVTMINRNPEIYDQVIHIDTGGVFDWYTDIERFTDYSQTHETPWQLQYGTIYEDYMYPDYAYYFHLDFSAEDEVCIAREMLDFENCDYELIVRARDAQGVLSNPKTLIIPSLNRA